MMRQPTFLSLLVLYHAAFASPSPDSDLSIRSPNDCEAVTVIISILSQYKASATSFCSSFISISVATVTSTNVFPILFLEIYEGVADFRRL